MTASDAPPSVHSPRTFTLERRTGASDTGRRIILSLAVALMGLVDLGSALLSHPPERLTALRRLIPTEVLDTSRTFTLLAGALLLVTAWGLRRGKRRAYVIALFLCAISVPFNVLKALDIEEAVVATGMMFLLGVSADAFRVKSRELSPRSLRSGALWFAIGLAAYAVAGEVALEWRYGIGTSWRQTFLDAGYYLFGIGNPVRIVSPELPYAEARIVTWYHRSLPILGLAFALLLAIGSLRPARHRHRHREQAERVAALLREYGDSTVSAFALGDDADYFFSPNGRAVIAYRFEADTLIAIGDPVGPPDELPSLLREFENFCRERDWQFAFFQARPERLELYRSLGWRWIHIGEDPILWTERFTLAGGAAAEARRAVHKAEQAGLEVRHFVPGVNPFGADAGDSGGLELLDELREVSRQWVDAHAGHERTFCMGRFDPHRLGEVWLAVVWNPGRRRVEGFATWVPIWARRGWAIDLMRRRVDSAPGTMELLVVRSVEQARAHGDALLSLSLSALARVGLETASDAIATPAKAAEPETDRAREFLSQHLARFYDFKGLFRWKKKFNPEFEDRYLVYPAPLALPRVAYAIVRAQSPGGLGAYVRQLLPARAPAASANSPGPERAAKSAA